MYLGLNHIHAQNNTLTTGGEASSDNGSISYSIGQIDYTSAENSFGYINQGVQQPFEIVTLSGNEIYDISIIAQAYPNPTLNSLIISVENFNYENLLYTLYDSRGREIIVGKITNSETIINMQSFASATYILKLANNNKEIKSFKILKKE
jgi:hypothetical protein